MIKLTRHCICLLSQSLKNLTFLFGQGGNGFPSFGLIEVIDCDGTCIYVDTSDFGHLLPYNSHTFKVDHVGELISNRVYLTVYPGVEREVRRAGTYVAWKDGLTQETLESCRA